MKKSLIVTGCVLLSIISIPLGFFGFIAIVFGNIGSDTVVQSIESPNGTYYAEVINSDQGALGGATLVDVYENGDRSTSIFGPQRVYNGEWGEFEDMQIYWKDENCLVINSVEYFVE